ncbi:MAG: sulfurtransferase [Planctomycetia bacterium]|nr:sulfurtransferase [Planctomycetia bacterium]
MRHFRYLVIAIVCCAPLTLQAADAVYPKAELLIEPAELAKPDVAAKVVILDARERKKFDQSHVPHARWVDHNAWKSAFGTGTDAAGWSKRIGILGIGPNTQVVIYDDQSTKDAARIWWILRYWGHDHAQLLNGGWKTWQADGLPTSSEAPPPAEPVVYPAQAREQRLATKQQMLDLIKGGKAQIVDARSEGEFCGTNLSGNKRAGAMPGAKQLEWSDLIDPKTSRFKSPDELRRIFEHAGVDLTKPTATHCQSGGRASVMAFGLELMGANDVRNYYQSWSEWGNADDTPIVPGEKKK